MIKFKKKYKKLTLTEEQYNDFIYMIDSYRDNLKSLDDDIKYIINHTLL